MPVFTTEELWSSDDIGFNAGFATAVPQYFTFDDLEGNKWVVNTEGFDYPRYMVKIDMSEESN